MDRQRYLINWYQGHISPKTLVEHTKVRAFSKLQAIEFGLMRRPGLIVEVTEIKEN